MKLDTAAFAVEQERFIADAVRFKLIPPRPNYTTDPARWRAWYDVHAKPLFDRFTHHFLGGTVPPSFDKETGNMKVLAFSFDGGLKQTQVTFASANVDEAKELLLKLIAGWNLSGQGSATDDAPAEAAPKPPKKPKKADPEPEPAEEPEEPAEEPEDDEEDEEPEDEEDEEDEAPAKPAKLEITKDDLKVLKEAKKLREVLDYLINKKGVKSKKGLLAACMAIREKVPALARIEDLEERVPNAAQLLNPNLAA